MSYYIKQSDVIKELKLLQEKADIMEKIPFEVGQLVRFSNPHKRTFHETPFYRIGNLLCSSLGYAAVELYQVTNLSNGFAVRDVEFSFITPIKIEELSQYLTSSDKYARKVAETIYKELFGEK